jgi:hypothetical protein
MVELRSAFVLLLFIHASILMMVVTALSPQACIRYLQPVSVLTLLSIAARVDWLARRVRPAAMQSASCFCRAGSNAF